MKTSLFNRFCNLFRRSEPDYGYDEYPGYDEATDADVEVAVAEQPEEEAVEEDAAYVDDSETAASGRSLRLPRGASAPRSTQASTGSAPAKGIHVPLSPIVAGLSLELQSKVLNDVGDRAIFLPLDRILPQLASGEISLKFAELREAAPNVFGGSHDHDASTVDIPLSAVIPHLSPDMLARRHGPLQVDIPDEIVSPFADKGKGLAIGSVKPAQAPQEPTPAPQAPPAPASPQARPSPVPRLPRPQPSPAVSGPQAKPLPVAAHAERPPAQPPNAPVGYEAPRQETLPPVAPPIKPSSGPKAPTSATPRGTEIVQRPSLAPQTQSVQPGPSAPVPMPSAGAASQPPLEIALSSVADAWPDTLKQEIVQAQLADAKVCVPYQVVEAGLKRGRLTFPWKTVRGWLKPRPNVAASVHDPLEVELPLRLIAPIFVSQKKADSGKQAKVAVDKDIPNLFFGLPQPDTTGVAVDHAVNRPVDTNYYVWDDRADNVSDDRSAAYSPSAATEFITRYATPNEVVSRASALPGVVGAVIALPDGLLVASHLPEGVNGDTLAAFLPHLFGKVSQCTQELRMGEVNNLNFTVGNVPWKIWRVNALYFAAFGRKAEPLPTSQLAALAGELDHKAKA